MIDEYKHIDTDPRVRDALGADEREDQPGAGKASSFTSVAGAPSAARPASDATISLPRLDIGIEKSSGSDTSFRRWMNRLAKLLVVLVGLGAIGGAAAWGVAILQPDATLSSADSTETLETPTPTAIERDTKVVALGKLRPVDGLITIAPPYNSGSARISRILVKPGTRVAAGQVLAELDNKSDLMAKKQVAEAALAIAEATLEQTKAQISVDHANAAADAEKSRIALAEAQKDVDRVASLTARKVTSRVDLDAAKASLEEAVVENQRSEAALARYTRGEGRSQIDVGLAETSVDLARAELAAATLALQSSQIVAPKAGSILSVNLRPGELPGDDGVFLLGNLDAMEAELEVYQSDRGRIDVGQPVTLTSPALKAPLSGRISAVGAMIKPQSIVSADPAANVDAKVFEVVVMLDAASSERARGYTNLEVTAQISAVQS